MPRFVAVRTQALDALKANCPLVAEFVGPERGQVQQTAAGQVHPSAGCAGDFVIGLELLVRVLQDLVDFVAAQVQENVGTRLDRSLEPVEEVLVSFCGPRGCCDGTAAGPGSHGEDDVGEKVLALSRSCCGSEMPAGQELGPGGGKASKFFRKFVVLISSLKAEGANV